MQAVPLIRVFANKFPVLDSPGEEEEGEEEGGVEAAFVGTIFPQAKALTFLLRFHCHSFIRHCLSIPPPLPSSLRRFISMRCFLQVSAVGHHEVLLQPGWSNGFQ